MVFNFDSICRTCMTETADLCSIYESETQRKLKICCELQVWNNDGLPGNICRPCVNEVEQAFSFRERCKRSDISLRQILNGKPAVNVKTEPTESCTEIEYLEFEGDYAEIDQYSDAEEYINHDDGDADATSGLKEEIMEPETLIKHEVEEKVVGFQCEQCFMYFKDKKTLVRHRYIHQGKQFKCKICDAAYNRPDKLTAHMKKHADQVAKMKEIKKEKRIAAEPYQCDNCNEQFKIKKLLRAHFYEGPCAMRFDCYFCKENFDSKSEFRHHLLVHSGEAFSCHMCEKKFNKPDRLSRHLAEHGVEVKTESFVDETESDSDEDDSDDEKDIKRRSQQTPKFKCEKCGVNFASEKYYTLHIDYKKCNNEAYTCFVCNTVFSGQKALRRHSFTHNTERYTCEVCEKSFGRPDLLSGHKRREHNIVTDPPQMQYDPILDPNEFGVYQCQVCAVVLKDRRNLKRHYQTHSDIKYKCTLCDKEYNRRYEMTKHMRTVHGLQTGPAPKVVKKEKETKQEVYTCETCEKVFTKRYKYKEHLNVHSNERPYLCGQCGQSFKNKQTFINHEIRHGDVKPYKCEECSKGYYTKKDLAVHMRSHTGEKPYVCTECGSSYTRSDSLANHWKKHTGEKPYVCTDCGARYTRSDSLTTHRRTHTGERPFACEFCPKRFIKGEKLKIHRRIHTGERPYACPICEQRFTQKYDMIKHARRHQEYHAQIPPARAPATDSSTVVIN